MNLIEIAKSVGMSVAPSGNGYWDNASQLQAFADAITKEEIERLKDIQRVALKDADIEIEQLNAKVAMMREALKSAAYCLENSNRTVEEALSATEQDVTRWVNGIKADALEEELNCMNCSVDAESLRRTIKQLRGEQV